MATFTAVKSRGGGRGALGGVLRYTQQEEKTLWEGQRLVSGRNCTAQSALSEMRLTKERYRKRESVVFLCPSRICRTSPGAVCCWD